MLMIGVSEEYFWKSNPRKLAPYGEAYQKKMFEIDRISHRMGAYVYEGIAIALSNAFSKNSNRSYREKPYLYEEEERRKNERLTEEERIEKVEEIFEMLSNPIRK